VVSEIDLEEMERFHLGRGAMATLAVQDRPTSRYLLFDHDIELCGWRSKVRAETRLVRPAPELVELAFAGIHMISPRLLPGITGEGAFSIIESYLKLAESGAKIVGFRADAYRWRDVGSPESLRAVREHLSR
jgi:NDP-sugar pyrophosphorylase family protein